MVIAVEVAALVTMAGVPADEAEVEAEAEAEAAPSEPTLSDFSGTMSITETLVRALFAGGRPWDVDASEIATEVAFSEVELAVSPAARSEHGAAGRVR